MIDNKSRGSSYLTHGKALYIRYFRRRLFVRNCDGAEGGSKRERLGAFSSQFFVALQRIALNYRVSKIALQAVHYLGNNSIRAVVKVPFPILKRKIYNNGKAFVGLAFKITLHLNSYALLS